MRAGAAVCSKPCSNPLHRSPPPLFPVLRDCWPRLPRRPPRSDAAADAPLWNSSDLGEDVATLSYEQALRAHARYRPADRDLDGGWINRQMPDGARLERRSKRRGGARCEAVCGGRHWGRSAVAGRCAGTRSAFDERDDSLEPGAECARLHQRAAEAGLTVSAYLRSCALEAEALRAQVKQALAELKTGRRTKERESEKSAQRTFFGSDSAARVTRR